MEVIIVTIVIMVVKIIKNLKSEDFTVYNKPVN